MYKNAVIPARCASPGPESRSFNRSCNPDLNLDSRFTMRCPGMTKRGFTLIELLVVVLIIGILSAVALPQYEKAVEKSRVSTMYPLVKALAEAEQAYYMANGEYTCDLSQLDISLSFGEPLSEGAYTGQITGQKTEDWQLGCVSNGDWKSIRASRLRGKYRVTLQYSLNTALGSVKPGWYCVEGAGPQESPCQKLLGVPASSKVVSNWFGRWYKMDVQ